MIPLKYKWSLMLLVAVLYLPSTAFALRFDFREPGTMYIGSQGAAMMGIFRPASGGPCAQYFFGWNSLAGHLDLYATSSSDTIVTVGSPNTSFCGFKLGPLVEGNYGVVIFTQG